jgi:hypothetical protein
MHEHVQDEIISYGCSFRLVEHGFFLNLRLPAKERTGP